MRYDAGHNYDDEPSLLEMAMLQFGVDTLAEARAAFAANWAARVAIDRICASTPPVVDRFGRTLS